MKKVMYSKLAAEYYVARTINQEMVGMTIEEVMELPYAKDGDVYYSYEIWAEGVLKFNSEIDDINTFDANEEANGYAEYSGYAKEDITIEVVKCTVVKEKGEPMYIDKEYVDEKPKYEYYSNINNIYSSADRW